MSRIRVGGIPVVHRSIERFRPSLNHRLVKPSTSIVIEGFPRSANTFAYHAFLYAQEETWEGHVGHHVHVASQLMYAKRKSIPVILLVCDPEDTVLSLVVRNQRLSVEAALRGYVSYSRQVLPLTDYCVVAPFEEVTTNNGAVLRRTNESFNCDFRLFNHTEDAEQAVFRRIEQISSQVDPANRTGVARPTEEKERLKERRRKELEDSSRLLAEAERVYRQIRASR